MNWTTLKLLGYGGLIPFLGLGLLSIGVADAEMRQWIVKANALYGTTIVSFLGAIHWGLLMGQHAATDADCSCANDRAVPGAEQTSAHRQQSVGLVWGVTPSLLAWGAMVILPPPQACIALVACLLIAWMVDRSVYLRIAPLRDFFRLRTHLTLGAITGLMLSGLT